jgi:4-hydroxy-3-polyprenylbenzoate decarboxylase
MVVTRDPDGDWINVAAQRNVVYEKDTLGILSMPGKHTFLFTQRYHARGESMPVVISYGQDPTTWLPAGMFVPYGHSEYELAGALRGAPVEVIKGPITGLPFPATAEVVIEGEVTPRSVEERIEGPFGEYTGYYGAGPAPQPVVKVKALYHRNDPILFGVPPIRPPYGPYTGVPFPAGDTWDALEKAGVPDVVGVWQPLSRLLTVVAIRQRYGGHAKQALLVAAGAKGTAYVTKYVVVVDDDIDITNLDEVMWAVVTRTNPERSIDIVRDMWSSSIDPSLHPDERIRAPHGTQMNSRALIDACRPFAWRHEFPEVNRMSQETRKVMRARFGAFLDEVGRGRRASVPPAAAPAREGHFQDGM